jgi:hypothetical protein
MASNLYIYLLGYQGKLVSEVILDDSETVVTNVVITSVNSNYIVVEQNGSGGMGTAIIPLRNIVCIIE